MSDEHSTLNDGHIVDASNASNLRYWADQLEVNEAVLRLLIDQHGPRVADLRTVLQRVQESAEHRRAG